MLNNKITIDVQGDYLDSFVYSGVLFLLDVEFNLSVCSWDDVCDRLLSGKSFLEKLAVRNFILGKSASTTKDINCNFSIDQNDINELIFHKLELNEWPSDINIYRNRFYISSSSGTFYFDFFWEGGRISSFSRISKIIDLPSFKIAPGSYGRLVVAAGNDGVCSISPKKKFIQDTDVSTIIPDPCNYLDWFENRVIANTKRGVRFANYQPIINKKDFKGTKKEYWDEINRLKSIRPEIQEADELFGKVVVSSFYNGNKLYYVDSDGNIISGCGEIISSINQLNLSDVTDCYVNSSSFGALIEVGDSLFLLNDLGLNEMEEQFANYRVFPRAKYYSNHLHVIKDDCLSIKLFAVSSTGAFTYRVNEILRS